MTRDQELKTFFVDSTRLGSTSTSPVINDPSDHDTLYIMINNIAATTNLIPLKQGETVNNKTIMQFQLFLKNEI